MSLKLSADSYEITYAEGKKLTSKKQHVKADLFVEKKCISAHKSPWHSIGVEEPDHYLCKPIKGYNIITYTIEKRKNGSFNCNCQFNVTTHKMCSHILAVLLFKKGRTVRT